MGTPTRWDGRDGMDGAAVHPNPKPCVGHCPNIWIVRGVRICEVNDLGPEALDGSRWTCIVPDSPTQNCKESLRSPPKELGLALLLLFPDFF
ncbi:MAG: hypothetical protein ACO4CG_03455 [Prochlorothrix sp.]|nr:hypothetical protein [Prochlorothrix sp.]